MEKQKKPKKKASKAKLVLIIGIIIILIPCLIFGGILLSAALQTGKPVLGERFANDLDPAITDQDTASLIADIKSISNVENCTVNLTSAQYRINVDVIDGATDEQVSDIADQVYKKVESKLPVSTYFTASGSKKMYDLSINVYNFHCANI